jgi:phosphoribosylanthranilate isomerase
MPRTRVKMCGLTREADVQAAVAHGVDALGLVFYPPSPRAVSVEQAQALARHVPPFVTLVGLFVNASPADIAHVRAHVPLQLLQFHGDEAESDCQGHGLPWIRALRVRPGIDLLKSASAHPGASGLLVDTFTDAYGGSGQTFDWSLLPFSFDRPLILSGGLGPENVASAIGQIRPWAVDVSSGIERTKGVKDPEKIAAFMAGVRNADT